MLDATVLLTVEQVAAGAAAAALAVPPATTQELLYPPRHQMTLPLNGLNMLFSDYIVAVNHHTKLDSDRCSFFSGGTGDPLPPKERKFFSLFLCRNFFLDFDAYGHLSSLEQNFNPSREDVQRKTRLGRRMLSLCVCARAHARVPSLCFFFFFSLSVVVGGRWSVVVAAAAAAAAVVVVVLSLDATRACSPLVAV